MILHPLTDTITNLIKSKGFWYESFTHEPVRTSEEAAKVRSGYEISQGAKALIVKIKDSEGESRFLMLVIPGDKRFDKDKVKKLLKIKDIRFATEEEVKEVTKGVELGGVPPFGNLFNLRVVADEGIFSHQRIIFNAGDRRFSIAMNSSDYREIVKPEVVDCVVSDG